MISLYEERKNYEIMLNDFVKTSSILGGKATPLAFADDTLLNKLMWEVCRSKTDTKSLARKVKWKNFRGLGHWLNILKKEGILDFESSKKKKIWKITKRGIEFMDVITKISYPKSKFVLIIRLANNLSIEEMATRLGFSKDHYIRMEKRGYPWSYKKSKRIFQLLPKTIQLNKDVITKRLNEWLINKRMNYLRTRGNYSRPERLEKQPAFPSEKLIIKILKKFGLKLDNDFIIHKNINGNNVDIVVGNNIFIEIIKSTSNLERTYLMIENSLNRLANATEDISKRIVIIIPGEKGRIGCECLDLLKGRALVFFTSYSFPNQNIKLLESLREEKTIKTLEGELKKPVETIRSRLKALTLNNFVERKDKFTWIITNEGNYFLKLCKKFLTNTSNFISPEPAFVQENIKFLDKIIELRKNSISKAKVEDAFSSKLIKILKHHVIKVSQKGIKTEFNLKFPDIIVNSKKQKFLIECIRSRKSALYFQVLRLAYKIKILKTFAKEKFVSIAVVSCKDEPLEFIPPNKPFKLLSKICDKIFIDANLNELVRFIKTKC